METSIYALPDDLLAVIFTRVGGWEPKHLAICAQVSRRFLGIVTDRCWHMKAIDLLPLFKESEFGRRRGGSDWKSCYKLLSYVPAPLDECHEAHGKPTCRKPEASLLKLVWKASRKVSKTLDVVSGATTCFLHEFEDYSGSFMGTGEILTQWSGWFVGFPGSPLHDALFPPPEPPAAKSPNLMECFVCGGKTRLLSEPSVGVNLASVLASGKGPVEAIYRSGSCTGGSNIKDANEIEFEVCAAGHIHGRWSYEVEMEAPDHGGYCPFMDDGEEASSE